jgi:4-hydroxy-3-methylbut-2-enyl diphosphate reductase
MAIKALTWMVRVFDPPVYCFHQIVHNQWVVRAFEEAGVVFVDDIAQVPRGAPIMLSAHGSAPEVMDEAQRRGAVVIDAVCPLVTKVHHEVKRMAGRGLEIIYVGHRGHDEAVGTVAEAPNAITLVEPEAGLTGFRPRDPSRVALVAQTTLGLHEWEHVLAEARRRFSELEVSRKSDLCYATTNRQAAVTALANKCDLILVVGSDTSSNTQALVRVAHQQGRPAHRIDRSTDIDPGWLAGVDVVGLTAGASAPDHLVEEVIERLQPLHGVELAAVTAEDEYFPLPPQLRGFVSVLQALVEAGLTARPPRESGYLECDRDWSATDALAVLSSP